MKHAPRVGRTSSIEKNAGDTWTPRTASGAMPVGVSSASVKYQFRPQFGDQRSNRCTQIGEQPF
jgi:hypothetical protein